MKPLFLNVAKPCGWTSTRVLAAVKRSLGPVKIGHWGTLDPMAAGVLPVALGGATRLLPYIQDQAKVYHAVIRLGIETTTLDREGEVLRRSDPPALTRDLVERVLAGFVGEIDQVPPAFCALRVNGARAYKAARRGAEVTIPARRVRIDDCSLLCLRPPDLVVRVSCGPGTYIRSLARDVGVGLGCGGSLWHLVRTRSGPFRLRDARSPWRFTPEALAAGAAGVVDPVDVLGIPVIDLSADEARDVVQGKVIRPAGGAGSQGAGSAVALTHRGGMLGIGSVGEEGEIHPTRVVAAPGPF